MAKSINKEKIEKFTKVYNWLFTDIVKSADPTVPTKEQLEKIQKFYEFLASSKIMRKKDPNRVLVPAGDGYVIGFSDSIEKPLLLAIDLLKQIKKYNKKIAGKRKLSVRVGLDVGPVYVVRDFAKNNTYWGPGMITAKRIMDAGKDNHILASKQFADNTSVLRREYKSYFHPIGEYVTKHGKQIEIFNVYGDDFGNKIFPRKEKIMKRKETDKDRRATSNFEFRKIDIILDVTNPKIMMTHHTYKWDIVNVSGKSLPQLVYLLDGDRPREFSDLNVKVTDSNGNNLEIVSIDENKPTHKEFHVKFRRPIKPRQLIKNLKLEYDWEEPERKFSFKLPTNCKIFSYKFTIPKGEEKRLRVLKRIGLGGWERVEKPSVDTKYTKKQTALYWKAKNLKAYDEYGIQW